MIPSLQAMSLYYIYNSQKIWKYVFFELTWCLPGEEYSRTYMATFKYCCIVDGLPVLISASLLKETLQYFYFALCMVLNDEFCKVFYLSSTYICWPTWIHLYILYQILLINLKRVTQSSEKVSVVYSAFVF